MINTAAIFLMVITIMMVTATTTTIPLQIHKIYAENQAKDLCSQYDGDWNNGKCKIKKNEDKTYYEDELCDDAKDTKKYANICKGKGNSDYLNYFKTYFF